MGVAALNGDVAGRLSRSDLTAILHIAQNCAAACYRAALNIQQSVYFQAAAVQVGGAGGGQRHIAIGESDLAGFGANDAIVVENNVQSGCLRAAGLDEGVVVVEDDVRFAGEGGIIPGITAALVVPSRAVAAVDGAGLQPGNCAVIGDGTAVQTLRHCSSGVHGSPFRQGQHP